MGEDAAPVAPRRRLIHRVPTPLRQHWKLAAAFIAFVAVLAGVFGQTRVRPYITGDATVIASQVTENITGSVDFFDTSVEHTFSVEFSESDYDKFIDAYATDGEKEWIEADITYVDGTKRAVPLRARIDTFDELDYFRNGGILHYVLSGLAREAA